MFSQVGRSARSVLVLGLAVLLFASAWSPGVAEAVPSPQAKPPAAEAPPEPPPAPDIDSDESAGLERVIHRGDKVGFGSPVEVGANEIVRGNVVCVGSSADIAGQVRGDVVVVGGALSMSGRATGDVVGVGSSVELSDSAEIGGSVVNVGGRLERDSAKVGGQVVDIGMGAGLNVFPGGFPVHFGGFPSMWGMFMGFKLFALAVVFFALVVIAAVVPERVRRLQEETSPRLGLAFLAGLLAYAALPVVLLLLGITIIGIPVAILVYFVFLVFKWLGLAGLFAEIGRRIGRTLFGRDLSLLGGIALGFLPFAVLRFVPFCIGWVLWFFLEIVAIGLVILTRAGSPPRPAPPPVGLAPPPAIADDPAI